MKCSTCRTTGPLPSWGPQLCCRDATWELGAWEFGTHPDVGQWLRIRAIRVAWLIGARRHIPGLTVGD